MTWRAEVPVDPRSQIFTFWACPASDPDLNLRFLDCTSAECVGRQFVPLRESLALLRMTPSSSSLELWAVPRKISCRSSGTRVSSVPSRTACWQRAKIVHPVVAEWPTDKIHSAFREQNHKMSYHQGHASDGVYTAWSPAITLFVHSLSETIFVWLSVPIFSLHVPPLRVYAAGVDERRSGEPGELSDVSRQNLDGTCLVWHKLAKNLRRIWGLRPLSFQLSILTISFRCTDILTKNLGVYHSDGAALFEPQLFWIIDNNVYSIKQSSMIHHQQVPF